MAPEVTVALITSGVGFLVAVSGVGLNNSLSRKIRQEQVQDVMARYRDPLLWSVHDLRSRIRTILEEDFLERGAGAEPPSAAHSAGFSRSYARRHTMFVLAEYLGWVEILRRTVGFLDLGDHHRNRRMVELLSDVRKVLFAVNLDPLFHLPAGHQRAVGELMITADTVGDSRGWRCIGFAEFCARLDKDGEFAAWFEPVEQAIVDYAADPAQGHNRLAELNLRLTDLVDFLDPDRSRFPLRHEERPRYLLPTGTP